jgi:uncharacterized membrane protein
MKGYAITGLTVLAGVALFEVALIPAVVVGGAAVLAPKYLPALRRRLRSAPAAKTPQRSPLARMVPAKPDAQRPLATFAGMRIGRAIAKTITFRIIVTTLDFTANYVVIGELTTAAGLSTFNLIAGPLFYLGHEATWNYLGPSADTPIDIQVPLSLPQGETARLNGERGIKISRPLAKTITYRTIATVVDFTTNYVVVGDAFTAAGLTAFGFVLGPFVYFGHEKIWDYYSSPPNTGVEALPAKLLLPAPA